MKNITAITSKDDFNTWQKKAQELFQTEKAEGIINDFAALLDRQNKRTYSWETDSEVLGEHLIAMAEMERLNGEFLKKWGTRYEEYLAVTAALDKEYERAMASTSSRTTYKKAIANLIREGR